MDKVTEGFLSEFSTQFDIGVLPEKDRFEQFGAPPLPTGLLWPGMTIAQWR
jgi:hypothetical protein